MRVGESRRGAAFHWTGFSLGLALTLAVFGLYGVNMVRWPDSPDFGWRTQYNTGPNIVAEVFGAGARAGLRAGDRIVAINGHPYSTFDQLFFGNIRRSEPGAVNTYTVRRDGQPVELVIATGRLGLGAVLQRSAPLFVLGLGYLMIGTLVFLMKPQAPESRLFFAMTCLTSISIGVAAPADLMHPTWLYDLRFLSRILLPASVIHLALRFPKTRTVVRERPWVQAVPYLVSFAVFLVQQSVSAAYWTTPSFVFLLWLAYSLLAGLFFLGSMTWNFLRETSIVTRLQSRVIFVGMTLGLFIPAVNLISGLLWQAVLFPDPTVGFGICFSLFPLSIAYTIVKHDLFAIDVIVRRTYGYLLSTGSVVAAYAIVVSLLNVSFQSSEIARSPIFSIAFALAVVLTFEPLHRRFQSLVDRLFYRQHYDYRKTIKDVSAAMTSILDEEVIQKTLIDTVAKEMFLENALILVPKLPEGGFRISSAAGTGTPTQVDLRDGLASVVAIRKEPLLRHDVELNSAWERQRDHLLGQFDALAAELVLPIVYKNELTGILSLGRKKSGKLFTHEDLDLLRTLTSQTATALENAKLFRENLAKGRMEEELKIAHDIQASMLPQRPPAIPGFTLAARSLPAREVGGDFYDFLPVPGDAGRLAVLVGDVSGKGVSGALMMAAARSTYRVLLQGNPAVADAMHTANHRLHADLKKGMFVALLYAVLGTRDRSITFANAGQTQPIFCPARAESPPFLLDTEGDKFPLGIVPDCGYKENHLTLNQGDTLVLYTDGVVEAMNAQGELYGFDRLLSAVGAARALDADALLATVMDDVQHHTGAVEQSDDITIVVAKVE